MGRWPLMIALGVAGCQEYNLSKDPDPAPPIGECLGEPWSATALHDPPLACADPREGGFEPIVEWEYDAGGFSGCTALPVVGDLDGDGMPEILVNVSGLLGGRGSLVALRGDGSGIKWRVDTADLGYGAPVALADFEGDGSPEIVTIKEYQNSLLFIGDYTVVVYDADGQFMWESAHFTGNDMDYATAPIVSDMDHDGSPEIIAGRVILTSWGATRGVGGRGRGSYSIFGLEAGVPAVTDIDLDGTEEVLVGNAAYGPDGVMLWDGAGLGDAMISPANLDDDPEGEFIAIGDGAIRAHDTNGDVIWGPNSYPSGASLSAAAVADLDLDGKAEIVFSGSNQLYAVHHDGTPMWSKNITDTSGATGSSIFDFEGDGRPEVVHVDEVAITVFDGATGDVQFFTTEHSSNTMFDYPVIADVDADGRAEIVVCHNGYRSVLSVYGDAEDGFASARGVWNQHAYGISNIEDDLSVPIHAETNFEDTNSWHSGVPGEFGDRPPYDLHAELLDICRDECASGIIEVTVRIVNRIDEIVDGPVSLAVYAQTQGVRTLLETRVHESPLEAGWASEGIVFALSAAAVDNADRIVVAVDDYGAGEGGWPECNEANNILSFGVPDCEDG